MNQKRYVQYKNDPKGQKWEIPDRLNNDAYDSWIVYSLTGTLHYLPKSEYVLCEPPEVWNNITDDCEIVVGPWGCQVLYKNKQLDLRDSYRLRKVPVNFMVAGPKDESGYAIIVERKQS